MNVSGMKTMSTTKIFDSVVTGGGPAGLFAAYNIAKNGFSVLLCEKNDRCGKKLDITGKGRCNMTNMCTLDEFLSSVPENPRFLYAALNNFSPDDTVDFFESEGVKTKLERGKRIFPVSDRAHDVTEALVNACKKAGVIFKQGKITQILTENGRVCGVMSGNEKISCRSVILATGGASYPKTGSDGKSYTLATSLGHTLVPVSPSLVPLVSPDGFCRECMGLSLKNVNMTFKTESGKKVYSEQGEMMFTHFGVTGPVILSASAYLTKEFPCTMYIDMKPALDEQTLNRRMTRDFSENINREFKNGFSALLPSKMTEPFVRLTGIDPDLKLNSLKKEQRLSCVRLMKAIPVKITGTRPIAEAIVTKGGISCREINPKTMESKIVHNLYFAGETIDVDACTGGFNLQIAFSTAFSAAKGICENLC